MSSPEASPSAANGLEELEKLESTLNRVIEEMQSLRRRVKEADERAVRSDELLRQFVGGTQDPGALSRRLAELEEENEGLRSRLARGREGVDQVLSRIRFLEDRR